MDEKMSDKINLKDLERRAYRSTFQDGLWDLYLGGIMACLGILGIIPSMEDETWVWLIGYTVLIGGVLALFILGKKYITVPRLGAVKYGAKRKRRKMILTIIMSLTVLINLVFVLLTMGVIKAPIWMQNSVDDLSRQGILNVLIAVAAGLFVTVIMCIVAYFIEFMRGMYIALLFGTGIFIDMYFDLPVVMLVFGILAAIPGLILLIRFIRKYPKQSKQVENDAFQSS
jgi:MFS family permease